MTAIPSTVNFILLTAALTLAVGSLVVTQSRSDRPGLHSARGSRTVPTAPRKVTPEQVENTTQRIELANAIVNRFEREAKARGLSAGWRQTTLEALLPLSLKALQEVDQRAVSIDTIGPAVSNVDNPSVIGDPDRDLTFIPIMPCRYIDTRNIAGRLNGTRTYGLAANGSSFGGAAVCAPKTIFGVAHEDQIGALAMNVTIIDPTVAPGFVAAKPHPLSPTVSLINWYEAGPTVQAANQGIIAINPPGANDGEFSLQPSAPVHVIVDLFGAFVEPQATALQLSGTSLFTSIVAGGFGGGSAPACQAGFTSISTNCGGGSPLTYLTHVYEGGCIWHNKDTVTLSVRVDRVCARIPGR